MGATFAAALMLRCAGAPPVAPPPKLPSPPPAKSDPIVADGTYWEDVRVTVLSVPAAVRLPFDEKVLAGGVYEELSGPDRTRVRDGGIFVQRSDVHASGLGAFYGKARSAKVPYVVTLDALFALVVDAYGATIGEIESTLIDPAMRELLPKADERLAGEQRSAGSDVAPAYVVARGVIDVARALLDKDYHPDPAMANLVRGEVQRIAAHLGPAASELLGRSFDYGMFDLQGGLSSDEATLGAFRARTWLAEAAMVLALRTPPPSSFDVTAQRRQGRAAMLLTHALSADTNPAAAQAWARVADVEAFLFGPPDDWDPKLLGALAKDASIDLRDASSYSNVAKVDALRLRAASNAGRGRVNDLGATMPAAPKGLEAPLVSFRLLGASAPPDSVALGKLVSPFVGSHFGTQTPLTLHDGLRTLPTAVDLAVAVGSVDAREILHETGDDAYEGFEAEESALAAKALPAEPALRHQSVYLSLLDAMSIYLAPSSIDVAQPSTAGVAWRRRKVATALGAWARLRHATVPFSSSRTRDVVEDAESSQDGTTALVEPHPEAIARLLGTTRQLRRGLVGLKALTPASPSHVLLDRVEALLVDAFDLALREGGSAPFGAKDQKVLDAMPGAIANIEKRLGGPAAGPVVAVVHADDRGKRFLEVGTGFVETATMVLRVPGAATPSVLVGAHVPFLERAQSLRTTDAVLRGQLEKTRVPTPSWQRSFRSE